MKIGLRTRGRTTDYLTIPPADGRSQWWEQEEYSYYTQTTKPTLIIEGLGGPAGDTFVRFLVTGIPSVRRDKVGTKIRYSLFGEIPCGRAQNGNVDLRPLAMITRMLCDDDFSVLGGMLDEELPEDVIEDFFGTEEIGNADGTEIVRRLNQFWDQTSQEDRERSREISLPGISGVAGRSHPLAGTWATAILDMIADGGKGRLLFLNLVGSAASYRDFEIQPFLGLLDDDSQWIELNEKKTLLGAIGLSQSQQQSFKKILVTLAIGAGGLAIGAGLIWLLKKIIG